MKQVTRSITLGIAGAAACLVLAGCSDNNEIGNIRATRAAQGATVKPTPIATTAPATVEPPIVTSDNVSPVAMLLPIYDDLITQAMPYGGLAALQFLLLAVGSLQHPSARRVVIGLTTFALCTAAALLALFSRGAIDFIGFGLVCVMGVVASAQTFKRAASRSVQHG